MYIEEALKIANDVREEGGPADQWLNAKVNEERLSRTAIIKKYGDPRKLV